MTSRPLVYRSGAHDAVTQLPVFVIDSTALSNDEPLPDPDMEGEFKAYLSVFPENSEFVLVFFASGAPKVPQVNWLRKAHSALARPLKKRIRKVYVVHASWYTRALNKALAPIVSPKFSRKIYFMKNLTELGREVDITVMDINPAVYYHDLQRNDTSVMGAIPVPKQCESIFGTSIPDYPTSYWKAALTFLGNARVDERTFQPLSRSSEKSAALVAILTHAVRREQRLRLYDYGPFVVLAVLKEYMTSLSTPLVSIDRIPFPLEYSADYANDVISEATPAQRRHISELIIFCQRAQRTVDSVTIARSLGPALMGLRHPHKQDHAIAVRLMKILIEQWQPVGKDEQLPTPREIPSSTAQQPTAQLPSSSASTLSSVSSSSESSQMSLLDVKIKPRDLPNEIEPSTPKVRIPNRKAFGKVAEIVRLYDETHY